MQTYFGTWINHVRPYLKAARVAIFDSARAIQYFTWLAEAERTVNTRRACRTVLSAMIGLSIRLGYRCDNPVRGLNVGKQAAHKDIKVINETVFWELCDKLPLPTQRLLPSTSSPPESASAKRSLSKRKTWTTTPAC
ncbi:hypothetical protein [Actinomadura violacea]|uniref:Uncharacterized protein n=1 Tax=Actinomadura violacea TaxID=2819934 RepID=A0ABS3S058_9ACTN|nr:hypothetical protein [Actinomadura violacea]MBO2462394.1 hypothetical protein [Actinomadura violacea]